MPSSGPANLHGAWPMVEFATSMGEVVMTELADTHDISETIFQCRH